MDSDLKIIHRNGDQWYWPAYDEKLLQVFDYHKDIDEILKHCVGRDVCIQAGGAAGVWPIMLATHFQHVVTFEPDPINHKCLVENIKLHGINNVTVFNMGLSSGSYQGQMETGENEANNCGARYVKAWKGDPDNIVNMATLNDMATTKLLRDCSIDLIQLDIEGMELDAIVGASRLIKEHKPVVVIEEKPLPHVVHHYTRARAMLENVYGFVEVGQIHRDVIFKHNGGA